MRIPTLEECNALLEKYGTPPNVAAHCRRVREIALELCTAPEAAGIQLNTGLVAAAALLHDIVRPERQHAAAGARVLEAEGFPEVARIVAMHMELPPEEETRISEAVVVYYADKLVQGERRVNLEERYGAKLETLPEDSPGHARVKALYEQAKRVQKKLERALG